MSNQHIEILKNNGINIKKNSIYPIYKVSNRNGAIVRFTDEKLGMCIKSSVHNEQGKHSSGWVNHDRTDHWRDLTNEEYETYVKGKEFE